MHAHAPLLTVHWLLSHQQLIQLIKNAPTSALIILPKENLFSTGHLMPHLMPLCIFTVAIIIITLSAEVKNPPLFLPSFIKPPY